MRAGTSRGPFFDLRDLPLDEATRNTVLLKVMGSPDPHQIDGLGGASTVTSKAVMVQPSERAHVDVDYLFAQVGIDRPVVDTIPTCGNMMTGVGPFAIEKGWVDVTADETVVRVYNINTDAHMELIVPTPGGVVNYTEGTTEISGVPGTGAPIQLNFFDVGGGTTGSIFPSGNRTDQIFGVDVTIVDASNLVMLLRAEDFGLDGTEEGAFFENNRVLMEQLEKMRLEAGLMAGLGDVRDSVLPRIGLLSASTNAHIKSRYLTPHALHPSHPVTGAICIAAACNATGTVGAHLVGRDNGDDNPFMIEHPSGMMPVFIEVAGEGEDFIVKKAGTLRTARKIMDGFVYF